MRFELLVPLLITTVVAILGWYIVNYLNAQRELRNTIIELRIKYILEIYRRLERTMGKTVTRKVADDVEIAFDDLQLLQRFAMIWTHTKDVLMNACGAVPNKRSALRI